MSTMIGRYNALKAHYLRARDPAEEEILSLEPKHGNWLRVGTLALSILGITVLRGLLPDSQTWWRSVVQQLYILPVIVGAVYFGWRGGLSAAAFVGVCCTHLVFMRAPYEGESSQLINFTLAGIATGILADGERKHKKALEKTTVELQRVYRELQENFERMKRSERLYAIGQMSAGLAHEIRNPLASIEGAAGILQEESCAGSRGREFLEIIQKESRRLNRMLTNFLEFARPRPPQYQSVDVGQILDSVMGLAAHAIGKKALTLRKVLPPSIPALECDPEQLKQVILNLTLNAIHAMPEEGEILLSACRQDGKMIIDVKDQGCGLNPEHLDHIFDPFFTTKEEGTGLGLPVAHQIVTQHGGVLAAKNNSDKGMTFSIILPLKHGMIV